MEKVQLSSCNCHIKAEEASSDITQHFCKAGSLLHQPFQFKPDSEPNTPSQTEEGSPQKITQGIFFVMTKTLASQSLRTFVSKKTIIYAF